MVKIKACIFDLDGVVVDTAKYHYKAWKRVAEELGFNFTEEQNEHLKGVSRMDSLNLLLELGNIKLDKAQKFILADKKNKWYTEDVMKITPRDILPGVLDFLMKLKTAEIKIALGSASKNALTILEKLEIVDWFDVIIDGNITNKAKPDPEIFLLGAEGLKTNPVSCVVFEDAEVGVQAALNAGMYCIGIGSPKILGKAHKVLPGFINMTIEQLNF